MAQVVRGLDHDIRKKIALKRDPVREAACMEWINVLTRENCANFEEDLKSGVFLCKLINAINPGAIENINKGRHPFAHRENIEKYLQACVQYGVRSSDNFVTIDLFEAKKLNNVSDQIYCLSDVAVRKGFDGPALIEKFARPNGNGNFNPAATPAAEFEASRKPPPPPAPPSASGGDPAPAAGFGQTCPACGLNIDMKAKFCPDCGASTIV